MSDRCNHPECSSNFPSGNWGWQRCLFAHLSLEERMMILAKRGYTIKHEVSLTVNGKVLLTKQDSVS